MTEILNCNFKMTEILNCNFKNDGDIKHYRTVLLRFNKLESGQIS